MEHHEIIEQFSVIQTRLTTALPLKFRAYSLQSSLQGRRGALVVGPRGVGKTTLLLKEAGKKRILYISVDNPLVAQTSLSDLAESAFAQGYEGIVFDEVHYAKDWSQHLKAIYDSHPRKHVWASDSNSLALRLSSSDLTRRFPRIYLPFLSFREYLDLKYNILLASFDPFTAVPEDFVAATEHSQLLHYFGHYKSEGFRPIFLEGDYQEKILSILEKTIFFDVPFFMASIQENHLRLMNAIIGYLATSPIPTLNIDSLAQNWSIGKDNL
jgi:predicted AAA+ superfamily ATPase